MAMNWYKRAAQTMRFSNFDKFEIRWVSRDHPPHELMVDMVGEQNSAELYFFVNEVDTSTVRGAQAKLFVDMGEDFIVDEEHSVKMRFTVEFHLNVKNAELGILGGKVVIPLKYVPEFKREWRDKREDLITLDVTFDDPRPAPSLRTRRRKW